MVRPTLKITKLWPISVIIPCYNQGEQLEQSVQSALDAKADQIIIFSDGSPDRTESIARKLAREHMRVIDFANPIRLGVCACRNYGIYASANSLLFMLDADDRLLPNGLERLYAAWQPGMWVYSGWQEIDENEAILGDYEAPPPAMLNRKNLCYASFLFHKDDWRKVGGFDPDFEIGCEDYAFQCALTAAGVKPVRIEGQVYQRMIHQGGRTERAKQLFPVLQGLIKAKYPGVFG